MFCWGTKTIAAFGNQLQGKSDDAGFKIREKNAENVVQKIKKGRMI